MRPIIAMTSAIVLPLALLLLCGCSDDSGQTPQPDGPCWFCVADTGRPDDGAASKDTGKGTGKGDASGDKQFSQNTGAIDLGDMSGTYSYEVFSGKTVVCSVSYAIASATAATDCSDCVFAHDLTLGAATQSGDASKCAPGAGQSGAVVSFGHGNEVTNAKGSYNPLYGKKAGAWAEFGQSEVAANSWSFTFYAGAAAAKK